MLTSLSKILIPLIVVLAAYLSLWPIPVDPQAWSAPPNPGYTGEFAANDDLSAMTFIDLPEGEYGPEDIAVGPDGLIYTAVHSGKILAIDPDTGKSAVFANTLGRPLGIEFSEEGDLWIADAYLGLMKATPDGEVILVANQTSDGSPILYADDVDIAPDGKVYFSDASTRFSAKEFGGTLAASLLDLMEHSDNGRVLVFDPSTQQTTVFASGLTFSNGVAVSGSGRQLFVNETGTYSVHRYSLAEGTYGERETILSELPGFPDNINRMPDGNFWVGIVSPRSEILDSAADSPFLRKVLSRLPAALGPAPQRYGFVVNIDRNGNVLAQLQDPSGQFASTTGAAELPDGRLVISSLTEPRIGVLNR